MKHRYLITYDLNSAGQKYTEVISAIKNASDGAWCTYWKSAYLIRSNISSATEISNRISKHLDANDRLIVIEVTRNYQGWLEHKNWDYINNQIFSDY